MRVEDINQAASTLLDIAWKVIAFVFLCFLAIAFGQGAGQALWGDNSCRRYDQVAKRCFDPSPATLDRRSVLAR